VGKAKARDESETSSDGSTLSMQNSRGKQRSLNERHAYRPGAPFRKQPSNGDVVREKGDCYLIDTTYHGHREHKGSNKFLHEESFHAGVRRDFYNTDTRYRYSWPQAHRSRITYLIALCNRYSSTQAHRHFQSLVVEWIRVDYSHVF
jgi:hypothetical protein